MLEKPLVWLRFAFAVPFLVVEGKKNFLVAVWACCSKVGDTEPVKMALGRNTEESESLEIPGGGSSSKFVLLMLLSKPVSDGEGNVGVTVDAAAVVVVAEIGCTNVVPDGDLTAPGVWKAIVDDAASRLAYCLSNRDRDGEGSGARTTEQFVDDDCLVEEDDDPSEDRLEYGKNSVVEEVPDAEDMGVDASRVGGV